MTNDEAEALGLRALAAGMEWSRGCVDGSTGMTVLDAWHIYGMSTAAMAAFGQHRSHTISLWQQSRLGWPDLRDPATLGVLLAQVRDALRCPWLYVTPTGGRRQSDGALLWEWHGMAYGKSAKGWGWPSEAEALVVALEAAP